MGFQRKTLGKVVLLLLIILSSLVGCSTGSSSPSGDPSGLSKMTEISSDVKNIAAASGGTVTHDAVTASFPAGILPVDATIKVSKVSVSYFEESEDDDPSLIDLTDADVVSATSAEKTLELYDSANIVFKINPVGFEPASIRLVVWDGYEWDEIPTSYDETLKVVSVTVEAILPFGTRIYLANPESSSSNKRKGGEQIVSPFVAIKVVGELLEAAGSFQYVLSEGVHHTAPCRSGVDPEIQREFSSGCYG
jgi:hypothetical protein